MIQKDHLLVPAGEMFRTKSAKSYQYKYRVDRAPDHVYVFRIMLCTLANRLGEALITATDLIAASRIACLASYNLVFRVRSKDAVFLSSL